MSHVTGCGSVYYLNITQPAIKTTIKSVGLDLKIIYSKGLLQIIIKTV